MRQITIKHYYLCIHCSEYLVGNRQLSVLPVAASIFMSFISAILILGNTAEMYQHGAELLWQAFGGAFAFCASAIIFVPILYPLNLTSAFQVKMSTTNE